MKGSGLTQLYPSPWLRPMADIDLLVRSDHLRATASALRAAGFVPERSARPLTAPLLELCFRSPGQQLLVELHLSMDKVVLRPFELPAVFARSSDSGHGSSLRIPSLEDQLLLVALHFAADEYQHKAALVDLELLAEAGANLPEVALRARRMGAATALFYSLAILCSRLGEQVVPTQLLASLAPTGLRGRVLATLFDHAAWPVSKQTSKLGSRWLLKQLLLRDSPAAFLTGLTGYAAKRLRESLARVGRAH